MKLRTVPLALLILGAVFSTAAECEGNSSQCVLDDCTVTIKQIPGSIGVDGGAVGEEFEVTVQGVEGDRAQVVIAQAPAELTEGEPTEVGGYPVTATEVSPTRVVLEITA